MNKLIFTLALICTMPAQADETWITLNAGSYHVDVKKDYNQKNYGVGIEHHIGDFVLTGGMYRNSAYKNSLYAMGGWMPLEIHGVKVGVIAGIANGYPGMNDGGLIFVAAGVIDFGPINILIIPSVKDKTPLTIGVQVKLIFL